MRTRPQLHCARHNFIAKQLSIPGAFAAVGKGRETLGITACTPRISLVRASHLLTNGGGGDGLPLDPPTPQPQKSLLSGKMKF